MLEKKEKKYSCFYGSRILSHAHRYNCVLRHVTGYLRKDRDKEWSIIRISLVSQQSLCQGKTNKKTLRKEGFVSGFVTIPGDVPFWD